VSRTSVAIVGAAFIAMALAASWILLAPRNVQPSLDATIPEASVAVLPFENLSPDKNNAFFASGIQDEILTRLAKIGSLKVISRTSTSHFASRPEKSPSNSVSPTSSKAASSGKATQCVSTCS
jgi:hypothetical protein